MGALRDGGVDAVPTHVGVNLGVGVVFYLLRGSPHARGGEP